MWLRDRKCHNWEDEKGPYRQHCWSLASQKDPYKPWGNCHVLSGQARKRWKRRGSSPHPRSPRRSVADPWTNSSPLPQGLAAPCPLHDSAWQLSRAGGKAALLTLHTTTFGFGDQNLQDASSPPEVSPDQITSFKNAKLHPHQKICTALKTCSPAHFEMWSTLTGP